MIKLSLFQVCMCLVSLEKIGLFRILLDNSIRVFHHYLGSMLKSAKRSVEVAGAIFLFGEGGEGIFNDQKDRFYIKLRCRCTTSIQFIYFVIFCSVYRKLS